MRRDTLSFPFPMRRDTLSSPFLVVVLAGAVLVGPAIGVGVFADEGGLIATASWDGSARLWDAADGSLRMVLRGHRGGLVQAVFAPDGSRIVTASDDGTASLWSTDAADAGCAEALRAGGPAHGIRVDGLTPETLLRRAGALLSERSE